MYPTTKIRLKTLQIGEVIEIENFKFVAIKSDGDFQIENDEITPEIQILTLDDSLSLSTDGGLVFKYLKITALSGVVKIAYHNA